MRFYQMISQDEARRLMHERYGCRILDVREPEEFAGGHLPGAVNIPLYAVSRKAPLLMPSRKRPLMVYCGSGARSLPAVQVLSVMGYQNLYNLCGGIEYWPYELVQ